MGAKRFADSRAPGAGCFGRDRKLAYSPGSEEESLTAKLPYGNRGRLVSNSLFGIAAYVVYLPVALLLNAYQVHRLGLEGYGVWAGLLTVLGYGYALDLGISTSLTKLIAECTAQKELPQVNDLLNTAFVLFLALGVVFALGMALLAGWILGHLVHAAPADGTLLFLFLMLLATCPISLASNALASLIVGLQRSDIVSWVALGSNLLAAFASVVAMALGFGVHGLLGVGIVIALLTSVANWLAAKRLFPSLVLNPFRFNWVYLKRIVRFSSRVQLGGLTLALNDQVDRTLIGYVLGPAFLASYQLASGSAIVLRGISYALTSGILPAASHLQARGDGNRLRLLYVRATRYLATIDFAILVGVMVLARPLVNAWLGSGHDRVAATLVIILAAYLVRLPAQVCCEILYGVGRPGIRMRADAAFLLIHLPLSLLLLWLFGYYGTVVGTAIAAVSTRLYLYWAGSRALDVRPSELLRASILHPAVAAILAATPIALLQFIGVSGTVPMLVAQSVLFAATYSWYVYFFALDAYDKRLCRQIVTSVLAGPHRDRAVRGSRGDVERFPPVDT